jgi:hypothetical protein
MYVNSMHGVHKLTVDEETRRRLFDVGAEDIVDGDKVSIDFDELSADMLEFKVRAGSLIQKKEEQELDRLNTMVQPFIQNLNGWSDENRRVIENDVLLPVAMRMLELSDTDISNSLAESLSTQIAKNMMAGMQSQIDNQQLQLNGMQEQLDATQQAMAQPQDQLAQEPEEGMPAPPLQESAPDTAPVVPPEGDMGSLAGSPMPPEGGMSDEVTSFEDLLSI